MVERLTLRLPRWPQSLEGFRIAQLSDLHFGDYLQEPYFNSVVDAINREGVDLAFLTGDYVTYDAFFHKTRERARALMWRCANVLGKLRTRRGCYAILGNHDLAVDQREVIGSLAANNIPVLRNHAVPIGSASERFWLAGLDDAGDGLPDLRSTLCGIPPEDCVVLGVHEPDYADEVVGNNVSLQLSGHSHGGQIRIPGSGAPVLPHGARKYPMGHYRIGPMQLYTNRGIGVINIPVRLFCPPEITVLTLMRG